MHSELTIRVGYLLVISLNTQNVIDIIVLVRTNSCNYRL